MVRKQPTKRTTKRSNPDVIDYIITATYTMGPYQTKTEATEFRKKASAVRGSEVSNITKTRQGYKFIAKLRVGCSAANKAKALRDIKKSGPGARVTVAKV